MKVSKKLKRREKGITLIALVITIIVLLILASVSIAMLTGNNGILTQAQKAKEETDKASVIEQAQTDILGIQAGGDTTLTQKQLKDVLSKYFDPVPDDVNTDDTLTTKEEYGGKYQIAVSDIYNGELKGVVSIPEGLEIGETVYYDPNGTYQTDSNGVNPLSETYSGSTDNPDSISSSSAEFNIDTWKVFDIDEDTGEVTLVPAHSTADAGGWIYLKGAQGYNNGVKILNDACSTLYGDSSKGITARSINITDIEAEGKMTSAALQQAHNYTNAAKYGEQVANAYTSDNSKYPIIYAQEKLNGVNGTQSSSGLEMSDQTSLIEPTANGATNGYIQGNGLRPTQTYWYEDNSFMQSAFETASNGINYYKLLFPDGTNTDYWVASRCVSTDSDYCYFYVSYVDGGRMFALNMFNSNGIRYLNNYYGLFPVVSLSSELISVNESGGFEVK